MKYSISSFVMGALVSAALSAAAFYLWSYSRMTKVHRLDYPLILSSDSSGGGYHLLPKGTVLYYERSYPEGFSRYRIYVNIDRMPLELTTLNDPTLIEPIEAVAPDKESLKKLLRDYPLTKDDLQAILKSGRLSQGEIREVFDEFVK